VSLWAEQVAASLLAHIPDRPEDVKARDPPDEATVLHHREAPEGPGLLLEERVVEVSSIVAGFEGFRPPVLLGECPAELGEVGREQRRAAPAVPKGADDVLHRCNAIAIHGRDVLHTGRGAILRRSYDRASVLTHTAQSMLALRICVAGLLENGRRALPTYRLEVHGYGIEFAIEPITVEAFAFGPLRG